MQIDLKTLAKMRAPTKELYTSVQVPVTYDQWALLNAVCNTLNMNADKALLLGLVCLHQELAREEEKE